MRVPHRDLERFRRDPRAWVARKLKAPPFGGIRIRNEAALRMAVHWLHKGHSLEEAERKLEYYARKDPNLEGRIDVMRRLSAYAQWYQGSGRHASTIRLPIPVWAEGPIALGGYLDRVDLVLHHQQRMQGIFLGRHADRWRAELRMPLTQHALADFHGWPLEEVAVGVQLIDGSDVEVQHYSAAEVREALDEFRELSDRAADML